MAANDESAPDERRDERERHASVEAPVVGGERAVAPMAGPDAAWREASRRSGAVTTSL